MCLCAVRASGRALLLTPSSNLVLQPGNSSDRALLLDRNCLWGKGRHEGQYGAWASVHVWKTPPFQPWVLCSESKQSSPALAM